MHVYDSTSRRTNHENEANPPQATSQLVIIGVGNPYRGDDAVGHVVAGRLSKELDEQIPIRLLLESGKALA